MNPDRMVRAGDLVIQKDIVERLGMNAQAVANLASARDRKRADFPRPIAGKGARGVWLWSEVESWYKTQLPTSVEGRRNAERAAKLSFNNRTRRQRAA